MTLTYETFMRHAKKVTDNAPEAKPVLKGVYHHPDRSLIVTDSFRMYEVKNVPHDKEAGIVYGPDGKKIDGLFPITSLDYFIHGHAKQEFEIDVKDLLHAADILHSVGSQIEKPVQVDLKEDKVFYKHPYVSGAYTLPVTIENHISLNALYLLDIMKLFKAADVERVTVKLFGSVSPVLFEGHDVRALLMPVRRIRA